MLTGTGEPKGEGGEVEMPGMSAMQLSVQDLSCLEQPSMIGSIASFDGSLAGSLMGSNKRAVTVVGPARSLVSSLRNADGTIREDATETKPETGERDAHAPARVSAWYQTSFCIMAEIMGTGVLSLPSTVAGLGYILGAVCILVFGGAVYYQGYLLMAVKNKYYSQVLSYGDIAYILHGKWFESCTRWLLYANWYFLLCYYILALTSALSSAFYWKREICFWMWGLVAVGVLLPFVQLRTFHAMSYISIASFVAIIVAIAIIAASFITGGTVEDASVPPTYKVPKQSFLSGYSLVANIIFSFQGQSEFYEMAAEMKNPKKFPLSLGTSQVTMTFCYLFTSILAYSYGGGEVSGFILYSLPENALRTTCAVLIAFHIIVAYIVTGQPLVYKLHEGISKATLHATGVKPALVHFGITAGVLLTGYVLANIIPFFSDMQGVIAAFAASPIVFFFPAYFYGRSVWVNGDWGKVSALNKAWLGLMVCLVFPFCFFVGLVSAIQSIARSWTGAGSPFACIVPSQL